MKQLSCADLGMPECNFVAKGSTDEEVLKKIQDHATKAHPDKMKEMSANMSNDEMVAMMKSKIKEEIEA